MNAFVGTGPLVRLALRRDRVMLPVWLAVFAVTASGSAAATVGLYPSITDRIAAAEAFNGTPSLIALYGRIHDTSSLGALAMVKLTGTFAIFVAVLAILAVVRHTRAEEETGRLELLGSTVVGRLAPLTAALIVTIGGCVALGLLTALGLIGAGLPASGSVAFGLAWASVGISFAAVAAVTAQLTRGARAAVGLAVLVLGVVYVLRAIGDTAGPGGPGWLTWLSPVGWGQQFRPYAGDRWWVLVITLAFAAAAIGSAYALVARRDVGEGLVPERPGPATATASLRSPLALAWRLQRGNLFAWVVGFALLALVLGNIASTVTGFLGSQQVRDILAQLGGEQALVDAYLATMLGIIGVAASAYGIQAAMRLRSEETSLHAEALLATGTTRVRWVLSHTVIALFGTTVLLAAAGAAAGLSYGAREGDLGQVWRLLGAALVHAPAAWVLTGLVVAVFGFAPRLAVAGWAALVAFVLLGELGPLFKLSQWVMDVSPYAHVPRLPGASADALPIVALTVVAALLTALGVVGFRRRDVPVT